MLETVLFVACSARQFA